MKNSLQYHFLRCYMTTLFVAQFLVILQVSWYYGISSYSPYFASNLLQTSVTSIQPLQKKHCNFHLSRYTFCEYSHDHSTRSVLIMSMVTKHGFNPFASRNRNTNVKWYETELEPFYNFVQNQPLLSAEQELQYGKALQMWAQVEQMREKLQLQHNYTEKLSNEELAKIISCSPVTLDKMSKYAKVSKCRLVNSNLKLVLAIVSRYRSSSIPNSELIAEGTRGLAKAVLRFDHSKGVR